MQSVLSPSSTKIVQPSGPINASNAGLLRQQLMEAIASSQYSSLLVDMSQVEFLDSAGLMALVSAQTEAQQLCKPFGLCEVSPSIRIIFEMTQLDRAFKIFNSQADYEAALT